MIGSAARAGRSDWRGSVAGGGIRWTEYRCLAGIALLFPAGAIAATDGPAAEAIVVTGRQTVIPAPELPAGETTYGASAATFGQTPALTLADILATVPGVSFITGSGPRDIAISIRGSDDRQASPLRNIRLLDDGFPETQPDGNSRTDLVDPRAYKSADVFEGPASTVFGNYAVDGAISLHTLDGSDVRGVDSGSEFGSDGLVETYAQVGAAGRGYDLSVFGSDLRGDGFIANGRYDSSTEDAKLRVALGPADRLVFKIVNNVTDTLLPIRLSLNQFGQNPFQLGCAYLQSTGCASVSLFRNGAYGSTVATSAQAAGIGRFDRRTIVGLRWEHDLDAHTLWRTQFTYDVRDIDQPTAATGEQGPFLSYDVTSDITGTGRLSGLPVTSFAGVNWNYFDLGGRFYNITPQGGATRGSLASTVFGHQWNGGARFQEEVGLAPRWHAVVGLGGEYSDLGGNETIYSYGPAGAARTLVNANRFYFNLAPEGALVYAPTAAWTLQSRVGTGYGTPQTTNLFIAPTGQFGADTRLKSQNNVGVDLDAAWHPGPGLRLQLAGFYEFFRNEIINESAGSNLQTFVFNAPASQHRGVELGADWVPLPRLVPNGRILLAYTYDNQIYTRYSELVTGGTAATSFNRDGKSIPGVVPNVLDLRLIYDQPDGRLEGLGGFAEFTFRDGYWIDNANLLKAQGAGLFNVEVHYDPPVRLGPLHRLHLFCEATNLANRTYVGSALNVTDSLVSPGVEAGTAVLDAKTGSILAGAPRSVFGGVRVHF